MRFLGQTEEALMGSIPKVVGILSCILLLGLVLSLNGAHTIRGEVLRVDPSSYFVKQYDGHQVRLHFDETTQMTGRIDQGEHIEAKVAEVNNQKHALAIRSVH
jgi:hypothetical protein